MPPVAAAARLHSGKTSAGRNSIKKPVVANLLVCGLLAFAAPAWAADKACLQTNRIYGWKAAPGNRTLIVTDDLRRKFRVTFTGICADLQWQNRLEFEPFAPPRLSCLAPGIRIATRDIEGRIGGSCPIARIETYTPEMEKADTQSR